MNSITKKSWSEGIQRNKYNEGNGSKKELFWSPPFLSGRCKFTSIVSDERTRRTVSTQVRKWHEHTPSMLWRLGLEASSTVDKLLVLCAM